MKEIFDITDKVLSGIYPTVQDISKINETSLFLLNQETLTNDMVRELKSILQLSDILYNNTDRNILPLDDGIYDRLVEKFKQYEAFEVCATPVQFPNTVNTSDYMAGEDTEPIIFLDREMASESLFINTNALLREAEQFIPMPYYPIEQRGPIQKMNVNVPHMYPKLVGTLDKCKFTLNKEAMDKGVLNDSTVRVFERDFIANHINKGFISPYEPFDLVLELKYDGVSVEADVTNEIISARTRGDTDAGLAADLTPILGGIKFPRSPDSLAGQQPFGMKFEAIITKDNLYRLNELRGVSYVNGRVAIIGLLGASDAYKYRNFITLIPLETSLDIDRETELEFMNKYYTMAEVNKYTIIRNVMYTDAVFQVYKFVQEAELIRGIIPYMYDGVVVSYLDKSIRDAIGRTGAINKYSTAIKFEPLNRQTIFTNYTFSVGQNGVITPLLHYKPIEFFGAIHTKSSGHSYARFMELNLREGDIINVEYTNDVIPYATKAICESNTINEGLHPPIPFPVDCPSCNKTLIFTENSAICNNRNCPERVYNRATNMMKVLGIKDFSLERVKALNVLNLVDLSNLNIEKCVSILGEVNGRKLFTRINSIFYGGKLKDYIAISAIGFENISNLKWKSIFSNVPFIDICTMIMDGEYIRLRDILVNIDGIGHRTAETIVSSVTHSDVCNDIKFLITLYNSGYIVDSYSSAKTGISTVVRFSGVRDQNLELALQDAGYDCSGTAGVTKKTDILIVPHSHYESSKTNKLRDGAVIIPIDEAYVRLLGRV